MILNIILDDIDLNDIFSKIIIRNIGYLSVFISILNQVFKMVVFHFFYDAD